MSSFELQDRETCVSLLIKVKEGNVMVASLSACMNAIRVFSPSFAGVIEFFVAFVDNIIFFVNSC